MSRRPRIRVREDAKDDKKFPNGISSTFSAAVQYWIPTVRKEPLRGQSRKTFLKRSKFADAHRRVAGMYPGIKNAPRTATAIEGMLHDIVNGANELPYYQLRSLAEYLDIPAGLLVLFTQCVSMERDEYNKARSDQAQADTLDLRAVCLQLVEDIERVLAVTKNRIQEAPSRDQIFMKWYGEDENAYLPNMTMLQAWADAFNAKHNEKSRSR